MDEFLRLLTEFGADEATIDLATRWANRDDEGAEPLTDDELVSLLDAITALGEDEEASNELLSEAVAAAGALREEQTARTAAAEQEEADRERLRRELAGETASEDQPGDGDGDAPETPDEGGDDETAQPGTPPDEGGADDGDESGDSEGAETREAVTAAGRPARARRMPRTTARHAARGHQERSGNLITLADTVSGVGRIGDEVTLEQVDDAMIARARTFRGSRPSRDGSREQMTVATIHLDYPEERRLDDDAAATNGRRVAAAFRRDTGESWFNQQAIVAAGGICAMPTPIYTQETFGNARRPVRDALVGFQATRGGVVSIDPPVLPDLDGAVSLWTAENDVDPDDPATKPCLRVECGTQRTATIDAIPLCLTFGNFGARTFAENDQAWSRLGLVAHARFAEQRLLTLIEGLSTAISDQTARVSLALDVLERLNLAATGLRQRHRAPDDFPVRVIVPNILGNMVQEDIARRMPGDGFSTLDVTRMVIERWLAARNVNVTWSPDFPGTLIGAQAVGALNEWPTQIDVSMFLEGTFLFLDGGTLDLGVVRDSTLNSTNDFQTFVETFEGVHRIVPQAVWFELNVCIRGAAVGLLDPTDFCAGLT